MARCEYQLVGASGMLFVSATSFFEFANPQLDSARDFSRSLTAWFQPVDFRLFLYLISTFDNFDLGIHGFSPGFL